MIETIQNCDIGGCGAIAQEAGKSFFFCELLVRSGVWAGGRLVDGMRSVGMAAAATVPKAIDGEGLPS
ncbi:MAG: hypothetical protein WAM69_08015 [Candidatus Sulfotelmatobacter sp.]